MNHELTPWYPIAINPVRTGVYQVFELQDDMGRFYSYWDGMQFNWLSETPTYAYDERDNLGAGDMIRGWRGLAKEPKP